MNTKTMRLPPRRVLTQGKCKEGDGFIASVTEKSPGIAVTKPLPEVNSSSREFLVAGEPIGSNQLVLAGYLSYEFLTNGTLLGEKWSPPAAEVGPSSAQSIDSKKVKRSNIIEPSEENEPKRNRYVEVANLLRADEAHFPGIVNPSQLARFLKL